jgi:molybdenum cofactor cytidylyltransferase
MVLENQTAGIILAAGASSRFGRPKQLLRLKDKYLIEWVLDAALSSKLSHIVLVLGHAHQEILKALEQKLGHSKLSVEINPDYTLGQSRSLFYGLSRIKDTITTVMFLLADQPLVDTATLDFLLDSSIASDKDICVPTLEGRRGNPCIFKKAIFAQIMKITGDIGARRIIEANANRVLKVEIDNPHFFLDVDTPEDLEKVKQLVRKYL